MDPHLLLKINRPLKDVNCHDEMSQQRKEQEDVNGSSGSSNQTLHDIVASVPCAKNILESLQPLAQNQTNLIISDETLSMRWKQWYRKKDTTSSSGRRGRRLGMNVGRVAGTSSIDWVSLQALLSPYWNITIIVAYRRYYEWLPSAKQQVERWTQGKPKMNAWPPRGRMIDPLFPDYWQRVPHPGTVLRMPYYYTDSTIKSIQEANEYYSKNNNNNNKINNNHNDNDSIINLVILNLHELSEMNNFTKPYVRTNFVCNALPAASYACQYSQQLDMDETKAELRANPSKPTWYDQLVMAAALKDSKPNGIRKRRQRHETVLAAQKYHEELLKNSNTKIATTNTTTTTGIGTTTTTTTTTTKYDFPIACPSTNELQGYLQQSLDYERAIVPDFYQTPHGRQRHEADFWKAVKRNKFCSIDTNAALKQQHWKDFFDYL